MTQTPNDKPDSHPPIGRQDLGGFAGNLDVRPGADGKVFGGIIGLAINRAAAGSQLDLSGVSIPSRDVPAAAPSPTSLSSQLIRAETASLQPPDSFIRTVLSRPLKAPYFGEFTVRRTYEGPVSVQFALDKGNVGLLVFTTIANPAEEATISIGKAYGGTDPTLGRPLIPDAGPVGDYLLSIKRYGNDIKYKYLHPKDLEGMTLTPGGTIEFGLNPDRKTGQFKVVGGDRIAAGIEGYE